MKTIILTTFLTFCLTSCAQLQSVANTAQSAQQLAEKAAKCKQAPTTCVVENVTNK